MGSIAQPKTHPRQYFSYIKSSDQKEVRLVAQTLLSNAEQGRYDIAQLLLQLT